MARLAPAIAVQGVGVVDLALTVRAAVHCPLRASFHVLQAGSAPFISLRFGITVCLQ